MFKAVADTIKHHPDTSIFKNRKFWVGEGKLFPLTKYKIDGWHLANSAMICSFLSIIFISIQKYKILTYATSGLLFILIFNLFYNKIFRKK